MLVYENFKKWFNRQLGPSGFTSEFLARVGVRDPHTLLLERTGAISGVVHKEGARLVLTSSASAWWQTL